MTVPQAVLWGITSDKKVKGSASSAFLISAIAQSFMVSLELVSEFIYRELKQIGEEKKKELGTIYIDDINDRTTAMSKDIYSLCFITCIKPTELITLCPVVKEEEKKEGD